MRNPFCKNGKFKKLRYITFCAFSERLKKISDIEKIMVEFVRYGGG